MAKKHWIYIKRGLSEDPKHRAAMGECIWLYMHIIDRADWETGIAFEWKDREEAADMSMPVDTLRRQRQKLEELDYIRTRQKQHSQDIFIMEWKNPRDYSCEVRNPRSESPHGSLPSENEGFNQDDNEGLNEGSNQVQAQVKTPTSTSKSYSGVRVNKNAPLDFASMTIPQARKVPTLKMFAEATGWFPADILWEQVHETITKHNLTDATVRAAARAWVGKGYKRGNVAGILEWAVNGIPADKNTPTPSTPAPEIDKFAAIKEMMARKGAQS